MIKLDYFKTFLIGLTSLIAVAAVPAQETRSSEVPPPSEHRPAVDQLRGSRGRMLRELGLLDEQVQQIRKLNAEKGPLMGEALKRLHEATRALDSAIYADQLNDADVEFRLKETELAQAQLARLRYMNELAVRRILTQEQLVRFRELRQQYEKMRHGLEKLHRDKIERRRSGKEMGPTDGRLPHQRFVRPKTVL